MIRKRKRLGALFLSITLIMTHLPMMVMAENAAPEDGSIASFELLDSSLTKQTVFIGTSSEDLALPDKVTATIYHVTENTEILDEDSQKEENDEPSTAASSDEIEKVLDSNTGTSSIKDSTKTTVTVTTSTEEIPVTWDSEPTYDGNKEGSYVFTAEVGSYSLSSSAKFPQITITVTADTEENQLEKQPENQLEDQLKKPIFCMLTEGCTLTEGHEGECVPTPLTNDSLVKKITDWTFVDNESWSGGELTLTDISKDKQADFDMVVSKLPKQISAELENEEEPATLDIVGWSCSEYRKDSEHNWPLSGEYIFTAELQSGYVCEPFPTIKVALSGANEYANTYASAYANNTLEKDGIKIAASHNGEVEYTEGSGFTLKGSGSYEISGKWSGNLDTSGDTNKAVITVPSDVTADVTLNNAEIDVMATDYACAFVVTPNGVVSLTLSGTNTLISGSNRAGLEVPEDARITIDGDGSLMAAGWRYGAGIGGGEGGSGGNIEISGNAEVMAQGGGYGGAGIGGGGGRDSDGGEGGSIKIGNNAKVTIQYMGGNGAGIGGGEGFNGNGGSGGIIEVSGNAEVTVESGFSAGIGGGNGDSEGGSGGNILISGSAEVTVEGASGAGIGGGEGFNGNGGSGGIIEISGDAKVTVESFSSAGIGGGSSSSGGNGGEGGNILISGSAEVTAQSHSGAGIGGGGSSSSGNGNGGEGGNIEIGGNAKVTAESIYGAGIGGGSSSSGGNGGEGGNIEIGGNAEVTAQGSSNQYGNGGAGIGGGANGNGGNILISGSAKVTAQGGSNQYGNGGAGIGGGANGNGGNILISGSAKVTTQGGSGDNSGAGIGGGGNSANAGNITINGDIIVFAKAGSTGANAIGSGEGSSDTTAPTLIQGMVFQGEQGMVHGRPTLPDNVTIPQAYILTVPDGSILTNNDTLTINGTITNNGTIENNGTINGSGTIDNYGTINDHSGGISVTVTGTGILNRPSEVKITFLDQENNPIIQADCGDAITVQAQVKQKNIRLYNAAPDEVIFRAGSNELGRADVINGMATLSLTLTGDSWKPGDYTIMAEYGGGTGLLPNSTGTANLTVKMGLLEVAAEITAPAVGFKPDSLATVDSSANYTVKNVTWSGVLTTDGSFDYDTAYTVEIILNAKQYHYFADLTTGIINGQTASVRRISDTEVVVSYTFDKTVVQTWVVAVENGAGGGSYTRGATVNITADNAPSGKVFEKWTADSTDIIFDNPNSVNTSFTMPDHNVTVTANYKTLYAVIVNNGTSDKVTAAEGETVTITARAAPAWQSFDRWTTTDGITFANERSASTTFIMPAKAVTVTAAYKNNEGSSSSGGGSSSDRRSYTEPEPRSSYTAAGNNISRRISRSDLKKLADSGKSLTISCDKASMTFDPAALKAILAAIPATVDNVAFTAIPTDVSAFPDAAALIGLRPVYDFTISYKDNNGKMISVPVSFPTGSASVSLIYVSAFTEVMDNLFMVYVDSNGVVTWLDQSSYADGWILADVPHFSTYGVAYKAPTPTFTDIIGHWAKEYVEFVAARELLSGTGNNLFSPDATMTRGMFVTALGRLAGINPDSYQSRSFTDVKADTYYVAYVEWAAKKNIVKGTDEGLFSPDAPVTREQMAVMMTNYAEQMGYSVPTLLAEVTFADNDKISAWAAKEVAAMQRAGIIKGKDGNCFDPQANATRAEVSVVLYQFVEIIIDPVTVTN